MKKFIVAHILFGLALVFSGCGTAASTADSADSSTASSTVAEVATEQAITYLDKEYEVKYPTDKIITASLESMEDAVALGVKPMGAITVGDDFPSYLKNDLGADVQNIGDKFGPDVEAITALAPDVILGTTKFDDAVTANLTKIAPTINVSHLSEDWANNLRLLGELSGTADTAEQKITEYQERLDAVKKEHSEIAEKTAVMVRIRGGELCVYGPTVYYNPMLYQDLGFKVPDELADINGQTTISVEQFANWDADVIFVQFGKDENAGYLDFLDELKENAIWKSIPAVSSDDVYYNIVDSGYQGGTYLSKEQFLNAIEEKF